MEQNSSQNQNASFFQKNQTYIISAAILIVAVLIIYFAARGDQNQNEANGQENDQTTEETTDNTADQNTNEQENQNDNQDPQDSMEDQPDDTADQERAESGNVTARGTLRASDNAERGNLMIEGTDVGKVYIHTVRDFSSLIEKEVDLRGEGTIQSFVFLGLTETDGSQTPDDGDETPPAVGGPEESERDVSFSGTLKVSDDQDKGNYTITSEDTVVYLKTVRDYSGLVDKEVDLRASGSIESFTNAVVSEKSS